MSYTKRCGNRFNFTSPFRIRPHQRKSKRKYFLKLTSAVLILTTAAGYGLRTDVYAEAIALKAQAEGEEAKRHSGALLDLRFKVKRSRLLTRKQDRGFASAKEISELNSIERSLDDLERAVELDLAGREAKLALKNGSPELVKRHRRFLKKYREKFRAYKKGLSDVRNSSLRGSVPADDEAISDSEIAAPLTGLATTREVFYRNDRALLPRRQAHQREKRAFIPSKALKQKVPSDTSKGPLLAFLDSFERVAYADPLDPDLSPTLEIAFTQRIDDLLTQMENPLDNPAKVYEYVLNRIDYEPYFGSLKGSEQTLIEGAGNDFDQASLLLALLRRLGIPSRYVFGTVEVPVDRARALVGVEDDRLAASRFIENGIPVEEIVDSASGEIAALRIQHTWVRAQIEFLPYRGRELAGIPMWIDLDPSFKLSGFEENRNLAAQVGVDPATFLAQIKALGTIDSAAHYVTGLPQTTFIIPRLAEWGLDIKNYLEANDLSLETLFRKGTIQEEQFQKLPASLPYQVLQENLEFSDVGLLANPEVFRYQIDIKLTDPADGSILLASAEPLNMVELAGKRVSLFYPPDPADTDSLDVLADPAYQTTVPAYLVELKPSLTVEGAEITYAQAPSPVTMGSRQLLTVEFLSPDGTADTTTKELTAGGFYALTFDLQNVNESVLREREAVFKNISDRLVAGDSVMLEEAVGEILGIAGLNYFFQMDQMNRITAGSLDVMVSREPSLAVTSYELAVEDIFGLPLSAQADGIHLDIVRDVYRPVAVRESPEAARQFMITSAITTSSLVAANLEQLFGEPAVSVAKIIEQANNTGMNIYTADAASFAAVEPSLTGLAPQLLTTLGNLVQAGARITIPESPVDVGTYTETGYVALDPDTGASGFVLESGINGARTELDPASYLVSRELVQLGSASQYLALSMKPMSWLKVTGEAAQNISFSYLPAAASMNEWFKSASTIDEARAVASILAVTGTLAKVSSEPHISDVALQNAVFSPAPVAGACDGMNFASLPPNCFGLEFFASPGAEWTVQILDESEAVRKTYQGMLPKAQIIWDGRDENQALVADGEYRYQISADLNSVPTSYPKTGILTIDTTPPQVSVSQPIQDSTLEAVPQVQFLGTVLDETGLDHYRIQVTNGAATYLDEQRTVPVNGGALMLWDSSSAVPGSGYQLVLEAWDEAGNMNQVTIDFNVALPAPLTILSPQAGASVEQNVDTVVQVNSSEIAKLEYWLDTVPPGTMTLLKSQAVPGPGNYRAVWSSGLFYPGDYTLFVNGLRSDDSVVGSASIPIAITAPPAVVQVIGQTPPSPDPFDPSGGTAAPLNVSWTLGANTNWRITYHRHSDQSLFYDTGVQFGNNPNTSWNGQIGGVPVPDGFLDIHLWQIFDQAANPDDPENRFLLASWTNVTVQNQAAPPDPSLAVTITHPDTEAYESDASIPFLGEAADDLDSAVTVTLLYRPQGTLEWQTASETSVPTGAALEELGTLNAMFLADDIYEITAKATDSDANEAYSDIRTYFIASRLKVGNFTRTFTDYETSINGFPVTISRTYDSQKSGAQGAFGFGWMENTQDMNITNVGPYNKLLTWHDGSKEQFVWNPQPTSTVFGGGVSDIMNAHYINVNPKTGNQLLIDYPNPPLQVVEDGGEWFDLSFNPIERLSHNRLTLITREGFQYEFDGSGKLYSIGTPLKEAGGLVVTFEDDGIYKSGNPDPVLSIVHDTQGRIQQVTHGGAVIDYLYDANGNLEFVRRNWDPVLQKGTQTQYVYGDGAAFPKHYLLEVWTQTGWNGTAPVMAKESQVSYENGMISGLTNATGQTVNVDHDIKNGIEAITDPSGRATTAYYNKQGLLTSDCNALNQCTSYTYDDYGNKTSVTDPLGLTTTYEYGQSYIALGPFGARWEGWDLDELYSNVPETVMAAGLVTIKAIWNGISKPTKIAHPDGLIEEFEYRKLGLLISARTNQSSGSEINEYGSYGRLTARERPGQRVEYTYSSDAGQDGLISEVRDVQAGTIEKVEYDSENRPWRITKNYEAPPDEQEGFEITYTPEGLPETQTPFKGTVTEPPLVSGYDELGYIETFSENGLNTSWNWTTDQKLTDVTHDGEVLFNITYYEDGESGPENYGLRKPELITYTNDPILVQKSYLYSDTTVTTTTTYVDRPPEVSVANLDDVEIFQQVSGSSKVDRVLDDLGREIETWVDDTLQRKLVYDDGGRVIGEYDFLTNREVTSDYDPETGRLRTLVDSARGTTTYDYYGNGRLKSVTDADGTTTYEYNAEGQPTKTTFNNGTFATWTYNSEGRLISKTDENRNEINYEYDQNGNLKAIYQDPSPFGTGRVDLVTYDYPTAESYTRTEWVTETQTTKVTYDADPQAPGAIRSVTLHRPSGDVTKTFYETTTLASPQPIPALPAWAPNPALTYSASKRIENFGGSQVIQYYDENWKKIAEQIESGNVWYIYEHDNPPPPSGCRLDIYTNPGIVMTKIYDDSSRLESIAYPGGRQINYSYDSARRVESVQITGGTSAYDIAYSYDPETGHISRLTDNALGSQVVSYVYDNAGRKAQEDFSNGVATTYHYDARKRLDEIITAQAGGELKKLEYDFMPTGLIQEARVYDNGAATPSRVSTYGYDPLGRMTSEAVDGILAYSYTYYLNGSRKTMTGPDGITHTYYYDDNDERLKREELSNGINYDYVFDDNGNLTEKREGATLLERYTYDGKGRLLQIEFPPLSEIISYTHTPDGDLLSRHVQSTDTTTFYLTDPTRLHSELLMEYDGTNEYTYLHGSENGPPVAVAENGSRSLVHAGHTDHAMFLTNAQTGQVTDSYSYNGFGLPTHLTGSSSNPYLATGEYYDLLAKFYNHRSRLYSPVLGQFMSRDTFERGFFDLRNIPYGFNDPLNFKDPSGKLLISVLSALANREAFKAHWIANTIGLMVDAAFTIYGFASEIHNGWKYATAGYLIGEVVGFGMGKIVSKALSRFGPTLWRWLKGFFTWSYEKLSNVIATIFRKRAPSIVQAGRAEALESSHRMVNWLRRVSDEMPPAQRRELFDEWSSNLDLQVRIEREIWGGLDDALRAVDDDVGTIFPGGQYGETFREILEGMRRSAAEAAPRPNAVNVRLAIEDALPNQQVLFDAVLDAAAAQGGRIGGGPAPVPASMFLPTENRTLLFIDANLYAAERALGGSIAEMSSFEFLSAAARQLLFNESTANFILQAGQDQFFRAAPQAIRLFEAKVAWRLGMPVTKEAARVYAGAAVSVMNGRAADDNFTLVMEEILSILNVRPDDIEELWAVVSRASL